MEFLYSRWPGYLGREFFLNLKLTIGSQLVLWQQIISGRVFKTGRNGTKRVVWRIVT